MTQTSVNILLAKINNPNLDMSYHGGGVPIPGHLQLLMTLWLGKGETLISVSERFSVSISTVFKSTERVLDGLLKLLDIYICWPTQEEMATIQNHFEERCGFPGVIGAIDGTNIKFKAPENQQDSYIDKNSHHSIKLQAVGTANKLFINIFAGFPGSAHDHRVFRNSRHFCDITDNNNRVKYFPLDEYHLGDKAYPLLQWLMTPYRNDINLTVTQRRYNNKHSRTRMVIEHIFGLLKGRWGILKYINVNSIEKAVKIIVVCCILHNFCLINSDYWEEFIVEELDEGEGQAERQNNNQAEAKRNNIAHNLHKFIY